MDNGQSQIQFTQLRFLRPAQVARQFQPDEGYTGLVQASCDLSGRGAASWPGGYAGIMDSNEACDLM